MYSIADTNTEVFSNQIVNDSSGYSFIIQPENCKKSLDTFEIKLSINNVFYKKYEIKGVTKIVLPDTLKMTDTITIEEKTWRRNCKKNSRSKYSRSKTSLFRMVRFNKMKKNTFTYQENFTLIVKQTRGTKFYLIYKAGPEGCPKFPY
ncbi:MAG: hypothetical protein U0U66_02740 [Cytophagaceae bacterium]